MARKNVLNYEVLVNQSLSTSFTSPPTLIKFLDSCSYQINVTTTDSIGTFAVQVSNDYEVQEVTNIVINPGNWTSLTLSGTPSVAAANDTIVIDMQLMPYYAMRLAYTSGTAGTGICSIYTNDKMLG